MTNKESVVRDISAMLVATIPFRTDFDGGTKTLIISNKGKEEYKGNTLISEILATVSNSSLRTCFNNQIKGVKTFKRSLLDFSEQHQN